MITMRQHAISIAAIFLALAIGIVLGSGLLSNGLVAGLRDDKADLGRQLDAAQEETNRLNEQLGAADGFDAAVAGRVVRDTLAERSVLLVTTPDTDPGDVDGVTRTIEAAGGAVSGRIALTDEFVDARSGDRLRTVVNNVVPAGVSLGTGAVDQGSMAGDLLGSVLVAPADAPGPPATAEERALALDALRGGGFLSYEGGDVVPGQAAVVVTGGQSPEEAEAPTGNRGAVVARFAAALDARGGGVVLAGGSGAAQGNGAIAVARADAALAAAVTTVDDVDRESGRITVPLALAEQLGGGAGRYGTGPGASAVTVGAAQG
ncbi:copper transporter [Rhodococcus rhodnii]|uniref:Putative secreted protein n=1 Tax=Rhodococcus rhodnii LMG 5362 TaxID=1273125 RepID=R7WT64_9NOCA|nr:copper transporter [Rhodococcus rhodnii]EOM78471.1 putative secreted protein [Rhodococcus rhodnii LMG 5362]